MNIFEELSQKNLSTSVGEHEDSTPEDVKQTRRKFNSIGIESGNPDHGYIDRPLDTAIRGFQRDLNLKEDGLMNPKGETENTLNSVLQLASTAPPTPSRKPKTPPLPQKKPLTRQQKLRKIIEKAKEVQEETSKFKYLLDLFKKRNSIGFMKGLSDKTIKIRDDDKNGTI